MHSFNRTAISRGMTALIALSLTPMLAVHSHAAGYKVGSIQITQPWARATPKGASSGAAYMTLTNTGTASVRLDCDRASCGQMQIHEMSMTGGVMRMRPVEGGLQIKPGETITLKPGGFHVMLVDLSPRCKPVNWSRRT